MFASLSVCDFRGYISNKRDGFFFLEIFMKQLLMANQAGWQRGLVTSPNEGLLLVTYFRNSLYMLV